MMRLGRGLVSTSAGAKVRTDRVKNSIAGKNFCKVEGGNGCHESISSLNINTDRFCLYTQQRLIGTELSCFLRGAHAECPKFERRRSNLAGQHYSPDSAVYSGIA